ncbi:glycosyltransferase family 4 protein [Candidatus Chloroploca sp. M-50]|uniref:Glycosyltransferase family 4 protein n=1 Tax=Candidatus Chloroploca mongolica TaxID=2528176 RepID=A0ABS4DAD8_9CHLR|nr:glycosyltransferase family 4 protein [Candidatus Chloroploca mongolica]
MRIAMLAPFGVRPKGTLLARMLPLARALVRRGHVVTLVAPPVHNPEDAGTRVVLDGVTVIHTPLPTSPGAVTILEQSASLLRIALDSHPHLLHLCKPKGYSGLAALASRALSPRVPLVVDSDDWEGWGGWNELLPYPSSARWLFAWQERDLPRRAAAVTVASRTLESLVWSMGVPPERVFYLPNGIEPALFDHDEADEWHDHLPLFPLDEPDLLPAYQPYPTLLLYTRFWEIDLHELVAALVTIYTARPGVRLIVIGRGENGEEQELLAWANRAGFASMLDYRGWLDPALIPEVIAEAAIALVPTRDTLINRARCSAKLLELMGFGLAVVASDVGEARNMLIHETSGLLVPPGNPAALAAATLRLIDDEILRMRLADNAQIAATEYSWDRLVLIAEQAYAVAMRDL